MTYLDIIRAAIPEVTDELAEHILWERTPYPLYCSPQALYKAASRLRRASANKLNLCELCDNLATSTRGLCGRCELALAIR